jgi:hypothetical protein
MQNVDTVVHSVDSNEEELDSDCEQQEDKHTVKSGTRLEPFRKAG